MDIWFPERGKLYLTTIDKFSKYATIHTLNDRNWIAILNAIKQRIQFLGKPNKIVSDGDTCILHSAVEQFLKENKIVFHKTTASLKTGNSDVERLHGTLNEHLRIMNAAKDNSELNDKLYKIISIYNDTIHSTTKLKPIDFILKNISKQDIASLVDRFQKQKEIRTNNRNKNIEPSTTENQCSNIVQNRAIFKSRPKYKKLNQFEQDGNYVVDRSTKRNTKYHKKQLKRKYKHQH